MNSGQEINFFPYFRDLGEFFEKINEALIVQKIKAKIKALMKGLSKKAFNTFEKKLNLCQSSVKKVSFSYRKISA